MYMVEPKPYDLPSAVVQSGKNISFGKEGIIWFQVLLTGIPKSYK